MNETTILYAGVFCLAFVLLGMLLTVYEFRKFSSRKSASDVNRKLAYRTMSSPPRSAA